jgi:crotonobetainyl-CoA:carnitine CoA-transferase CaiB-like acyl-CoA transferase
VIEVTANWAGPLPGRHFADLGADVIKIELQTKPATRALIYPVDDLWPDFFHRSGYFNKLNRNKRAIALDLSKPAGRDVFLQLVARADVVLENNAARVMGQLGLAYDDLKAVNPSIVMCSMSGYGSSGPERNYSAYGSNIETASGLSSLLGYGPGEFYGTGSFYADPVTGNHGAVAMLAALHARRRTGQGQWIDMALLEAVGPFFAQQFLDYATSGHIPEPQGDQWGHGWLLQGTYHTAGKDCWLAVTLRDEGDLAAAAALLDAGSASAADVEVALEDWALTHDHNTAARLLQEAGVPAAPVMANWEVLSDNHLNDRGYFVHVRHPSAGTYPFPGFAWRFSRTPAEIFRPAPRFAEHNHEVFAGLLGLSDEQVRRLYAEGVTGDAPIYAAGPSL